MHNTLQLNARLVFGWIVEHPLRVITAGLLLIVLLGSFLPQLWKDTRSDAFLAADNPALVYRNQVKETFGLSDPMVIAVIAEPSDTNTSIFTPQALNLVSDITAAMRQLDNIDPERVTSLASENNISGHSSGMAVEPFYEGQLSTMDQAHTVRDAIRDFPLYQGSLVARDESATLIVLEILDEAKVEQSYQAILEALESLDLPEGISLHVAGEGAIAGYMGSYIDADAQRLNPLAGLIITIMIFVAFRRISSALLANLVIAASAVCTLGAMAASNVPFYVITNALPVILIGISVADSIHIFSAYYERRSRYPEESVDASIVEAMTEMWRPVTLTTLTTAAGFMGLYFAAYMPPFKYFGLFTAFGVSIAWLFSVVVLPAIMSLSRIKVHPGLAKKLLAGAQSSEDSRPDVFSGLMILFGKLTRQFPRLVIGCALLMIGVGLWSASHLKIDENRIETFHPQEAIYQADQAINARFDGTSNLDIVVETGHSEGLFEPAVLRRIEALQSYAESLPYVSASNSVVDYLKQMHKSLNEGQDEYYRLPEDQDLIAQYFLLYSTAGDPSDFEEEVDYDYRMANVRVVLNHGAFSNTRTVVEALEDYLQNEFRNDQVQGSLSGRVALNYHWIKDIGVSHFMGMGIALLMVWIVSALLFRSALAGVYTLLPVATSILLVYAAMVAFGIHLGIGTSMFAAVAIGLGVDFAIHTLERIRVLVQQSSDIDQALARFYPATGRALLFNLLAIALGFGVLISSKVVPLNNFGTIVALSVTVSFIASMTLLPALLLVFKPRFLGLQKEARPGSTQAGATLYSGVFIALIGASSVLLLASSASVMANENQAVSAGTVHLPNGRWVAEKINAVDEGRFRSANIQMILTDRHGKERVREARVFRKYYGQEKRTVLFYLAPRNVRDTGFLTYDYPDEADEDDQWLYLPALRKARRISASDRGDYFLGTDLSYEDMKKEGKLSLSDYHFKTLEQAQRDGKEMLLLESIPRSREIAEELGYGRVLAWVETGTWLIRSAEYQDINLNPLKSLQIDDVRQIDGIWTRHEISVRNHKTGHQTRWQLSAVDYQSDPGDRLFSRQTLSRGAPAHAGAF